MFLVKLELDSDRWKRTSSSCMPVPQNNTLFIKYLNEYNEAVKNTS